METPWASITEAPIVTRYVWPSVTGAERTRNRCVSFVQEREWPAIGSVCRFIATELRFMGFENEISTHAWSGSQAANCTWGTTGARFRTTTSAVTLPRFPLVSVAIIVRRWVPSAASVVLHGQVYGGVVYVPIGLPSRENETDATETSSVAQAETCTSPDTVLPFVGFVNPTTGGVVSGARGVRAVAMFESGAQFGTSSAALTPNQYRVPGDNPERVTDSVAPGDPGAGVANWVAVAKFASVNGPALE